MNQHILKSGEYPSNLAVRYVGKESRWPELCAANPQLPKHATYGCVFPAVGSKLNLPDNWPPQSGDIIGESTTTTTIKTPTSTTTVTSTVSPDLKESVESLFANVPALTAQANAAASPAAQVSASVSAQSTPSSATTSTTAPVASMTVIPGAGTQPAPAPAAAKPDGNVVKVGLIMASIVAVGVVGYSIIKNDPPKQMKTNGRRGRRR